MEKLMIKAIRDFKKKHRNSEIRSIYVSGFTGSFGNVVKATFCINYVDCGFSDYKTTYIEAWFY